MSLAPLAKTLPPRIVSNKPIPRPRSAIRISYDGYTVVYAFDRLQLGDAMVIAPHDPNDVRAAAYSFGRRCGRRYVVRKDERGEWYCWRVK